MTITVSLFSQPDSGPGLATEHELTRAGIPYQRFEIHPTGTAARIVQHLAHPGLPVIAITDSDIQRAPDNDPILEDFLAAVIDSWTGYRPDRIRALAAHIQIERLDLPADPAADLDCDSCQ